MKVRVVYKPDKSVAVIHPAPKSRKPEESEIQWLERVFNKAMQQGKLNGLPFDDIDSSELPPDKEDREAWEGRKGAGVYINQTKAKEQKDAKELEERIENKLRSMAIKELEKDK